MLHTYTIYCVQDSSPIGSMNSLKRSHPKRNTVIQYRGFLLIEESKLNWLVRPERSPMTLLPFRANNCSLTQVKKTLDLKLSSKNIMPTAA